ncbi:MAG: hypothetical protein Q4B36_01035 [Tissierellia bacterium]|nr:hypothetical protein [Tissierellia bacterium]
MGLAENDQLKIEQELEYDFLYNNDSNSLHILVSMFENKNFATYINPKYSCVDYIISNVKKLLCDKENEPYIILAIRKLITDDINRYELSTNFSAYKLAFEDDKLIKKLEEFALEKYDSSFLFGKKELFEEDNSKEVLETKYYVYRKILSDKKLIDSLKEKCIRYSDKLYKNKIMNLDLNIDNQLSFFGEDNKKNANLSLRELENLYKKILTYMTNKIIDVFCESYWYALNEAVLKRYD